MLGTQENRLDWLDVAKGVAITLVVYAHASRGLAVAGLISFDGMWGYVDYLIYTFHMPAFFAASGFLYQRSAQRPRSATAFWRDKILTVAWPYFLWTTIQVGVQSLAVRSGTINYPVPFSRLLSIAWDPISPFWYLYVLFIAFSVSFATKRVPVGFVSLFCWALLLISYSLDTPPLLVDIAYGLTYFSVGRLAYGRETLLFARPLITGTSATVIFLLASSLAYHSEVDVRFGILGTLAGLIAFFQLARLLTTKLVKWPLILLGRCTMGIYVMHVMVIGAVRAVGLKTGLIGPVGIIINCTILAVALPTLAQMAANRVGVARLVGLRAKLDDVLPRMVRRP